MANTNLQITELAFQAAYLETTHLRQLPPAGEVPNMSPTRCHRLLQWAAQDLTDPAICSDPQRLELERQTVIKRLTPHIDEVVELAWRQLQADQRFGSSSRSKP